MASFVKLKSHGHAYTVRRLLQPLQFLFWHDSLPFYADVPILYDVLHQVVHVGFVARGAGTLHARVGVRSTRT